MLMKAPEEDLALAAAAGDASAFAQLIDQVYDRVFALAYRLTGQRAEAEDLTQDICLALPVKLTSYARQSKFSTWLYRVTVNAAHDRRRKAVRHGLAAAQWGDVETLRRAEAQEAEAAEGWLIEAMQTLPEDLRDTLALTVTEGVTQAEAAKALGVSEGTVAWRMSEIKRRLRVQAEEDRE